jgi:alpha-beta hydrolase superfamily lysophospholipase
VLIFQHGLGEHCGRYQNLLKAMEGTGTAFYAMDARGHGRSEGKKGHVESLRLCAHDLHDFVKLVSQEQKTEQVFLLGHSLGGIITILYAAEHQQYLRGLILSSAGIKLHMSTYMKLARIAARGLASFYPSLTLGSNLNQKYLSHDPQVIADYQADPLVHGRVSVALGHAMFRAQEDLYKIAPLLHVPLYIMHGTGDKITDSKGSEKFYQLAGSTDKTLRLYDGLYHEMINEKTGDKEPVLKELKEWILAH